MFTNGPVRTNGMMPQGPGRPRLPGFHRLLSADVRHDPETLLVVRGGAGGGAVQHGFETVESVVREDILRSERLLSCRLPGATDLAERLVESGVDHARDTLASGRYSRELRRLLTSSLMELAHASDAGALRTFTLVKPAWAVRGSQLICFDPQRIIRQLRHQLPVVRPEPGETEFLFGQIHGEYDSRTDLFQLHMHGVCTGAYAEPLRQAARELATTEVRKPLRLCRWNEEDGFRQLSYLTQSFWPHRPTIIVGEVVKRTRRKCRIPEPWASEVLIWLDQQTLGSMQLKLGLANNSYGFLVVNSS